MHRNHGPISTSVMAIKLSSTSLNVILIYFENDFYGVSHLSIVYIVKFNVVFPFHLLLLFPLNFPLKVCTGSNDKYGTIERKKRDRKRRTMKLTDHYLFSLIFNLYYTSKYFCFSLVVFACRMSLNVVPFGK